MGFSVTATIKNPGDDFWYAPGWRRHIETHLGILKSTAITEETIEPHLAYKFEGNFYGLLRERGVLPEMHWIYLRVNNMHNPNEFNSKVNDNTHQGFPVVLVHPSIDIVSRIRSLYLSIKD